MLRPPHIPPASSSQHLHLTPLPGCGTQPGADLGCVEWAAQHSSAGPLLQQEPGSPAQPAYPEMLPGEQKVTSGRAGSGCSWQGDGKCCWRGTTGREQRGTSWELCSFQGGFQGGWVALVGASPQSIAPESWLAASPHPRPSGKRKQHVPRVCRAVPALLSPAARMVPAPVPPEPPGAESHLGSRELRGGTLWGTLRYLSSQQSTAGSCNGDIFNF